MNSPSEAFFDELSRREHVPWLECEHGALRYEVVDGPSVQKWTVMFDNGAVEVSQAESDVDSVLRVDRELFDRVVCGEANLVSAWLRGEVDYTGSMELLTQMGRLLPGPPEQARPAKVGGRGRRTG